VLCAEGRREEGGGRGGGGAAVSIRTRHAGKLRCDAAGRHAAPAGGIGLSQPSRLKRSGSGSGRRFGATLRTRQSS